MKIITDKGDRKPRSKSKGIKKGAPEEKPVVVSSSMDVKDLRKKHDITSCVAYLIGVREYKFTGTGTLDPNIFKLLDDVRSSRIVRYLCILRTHVMRNLTKISSVMTGDKHILSLRELPDLVPPEALIALDTDGVDIYQHMDNAQAFLFLLNGFIESYIETCRSFFPEWINWIYLSDFFIMPDGQTKTGIKKASSTYLANIARYPFTMYANFLPAENGNIFYDDFKFVTLLYKWNLDEFSLEEAGESFPEHSEAELFSFLDENKGCTFVVDCENSDPYFLYTALNALDSKQKKKVSKVILYDDVNTSPAWGLFPEFVDIPVEYVLIERIKDNKSLTDVKVSTRMCFEYFKNKCKAFVLVSSDSDYWGVIEELSDASFFMLVEKGKCSDLLVNALSDKGMGFCFLDAFKPDDDCALKDAVIENALKKILASSIDVSLETLLVRALETAVIEKPEEWITAYITECLKPRLKLCFMEGNRVGLALKQSRK